MSNCFGFPKAHAKFSLSVFTNNAHSSSRCCGNFLNARCFELLFCQLNKIIFCVNLIYKVMIAIQNILCWVTFFALGQPTHPTVYGHILWNHYITKRCFCKGIPVAAKQPRHLPPLSALSQSISYFFSKLAKKIFFHSCWQSVWGMCRPTHRSDEAGKR